MLNRWARYWPILDFINLKNPSNILEIGSGSYGLAEYTKQNIVGCDLTFPTVPLPNITPVYASCVDLPFASDTFELVVSSDMLEHIPKNDREIAIREMLRVSSRYVIIGCPCGDRARKWDYILFQCYKKMKRSAPDWLLEHVQAEFPEKEDICSLLKKQSGGYVVKNNENILLHYLIMRGEMNNKIERRFRTFINRRPRLSKLILMCLNFSPSYRKLFFINK